MPDMTSSRPPTPRRKPAYRGSSSARGYGSEHERIRKALLAEEPLCGFCGREWSTDLHHLDGNNRNTDRSNLLMACGRCHDQHHARHKT